MALVDDIAAKGEKIYRERYKDEYEAKHLGKYIAIDIDTGQAFLADSPTRAAECAVAALPNGLKHLIKIGSPGVYHLSRTTTNADKSIF